MNRCPDLVVCLKRDLQCLRPEASLVLIYRPNVAGMKGRVDLAQPVNRTRDLWFTKLALNSNNSTSASEAKLSTFDSFHVPKPEFHGSTGNRIINFQALMGIISILCCPECYATGLKLAEDFKEGLCSNLCVNCSCGYMTGFTSTPKENKKFSINILLVFGLRLIGRGFTSGKKLLCTLNLPCNSKNTFRAHELKLLETVQLCSEENMKAASKEVQNFKKKYNVVFRKMAHGSGEAICHLMAAFQLFPLIREKF
ncbi:uncharacterized protein TNCV_3899441 [Trichonephila clavipes]|nr:uncharacterized protein TNCV_3899441 [Trichonephila clavipes]